MKPMTFYRTPNNGGPTFIRNASDYIDAVVLVADTSQNISLTTAIAAGAKFVLFSYHADTYVKTGTTSQTATVTAKTDGSGSELNPVGYLLEGITNIAFRSPIAGTITLTYYK